MNSSKSCPTVRAIGLAICAVMVLQSVAFFAVVRAQNEVSSDRDRPQKKTGKKKKKRANKEETTRRPMIIMPPMPVSQPPAVAPAAPAVESADKSKLRKDRSKTREILPTEREIINLGPILFDDLKAQERFNPKALAAGEIKAIHPPQGRPDEGHPGVAILDMRKQTIEEKSMGASIPSPAVSYTFKSDNLSLGSIPPDTMGAVGPNHVVTTTNEKVIIHNRTGQILSIVSLNAFWAVTPNGLASPSTFDPKILFDRFNGRWILISTANSSSPTSATLIATSTTDNPQGTWNRYAIDVDAAATAAGGRWADYPSVGHNNKWITVSINRFGFGNQSGFQGPSIYVLNKALAYAGTIATTSVFEDNFLQGCLNLPTAAAQNAALGCGFTYVPAITETNADTDHYIAEDWDSTAGQLRMTKITGPAVAPVLTVGYQFPQSPYSWRFNSSLISGSGGYVPQRQQNIYAPSGTRPTANDSRIQNAVYRNGSFWTTHHVMLANTQTGAGVSVGGAANPDIRSGVQWWQINPTIIDTNAGTAPIQRAVIYDPRADNCHNGSGGTRAAPCGTAAQKGDFFTFPNIAVNANNDVLIGYSRFSPFTLPKAAYSFRAATDPLNTMRDSMVFREGQGNYNIGAGSPFNVRWGDYSSAMVDPVNDTDFWTIQEYALDQRPIFAQPARFAGLWSTWWGVIKPPTSAGTYNFGNKLIISEFRLRGPDVPDPDAGGPAVALSGARDEFVELHNPSNEPVTVFTTDGSDGWTLVFSNAAGTITALASIPNGTVIPAKGYYLITNEVRADNAPPVSQPIPSYSLSAALTGHPTRTADSDAMWTPDLTDNGGLALFRTANPSNFIEAARMDSVGFAALAADSIYREGTGLSNCAGNPAAGQQVSFKRKGAIGALQDTNNNAADFDYVSSTGVSAQVCQPIAPGRPTPCNVDAQPADGTNCTGVIVPAS